MRRLLFIICVFFLSVTAVMAQKEKVKNQPYADLKWFHLGFHVGLHAQDLILTNTGVATNGETWYAEIPSYSPGFSVGVIGDMYLNPYFNLRLRRLSISVTRNLCSVVLKWKEWRVQMKIRW